MKKSEGNLYCVLVLMFVLGGCAKPMPELGSASEQLYAAKCGSCHRAYNPHSLTAPMVAAGQRPLTTEEQSEILTYLQRNSGG